MVYRRFPIAVTALCTRAVRAISFRSAIVGCFALIVSVQMAVAAPFAAFVMDARNGEVILAQNADTRLHPASLTKMMTLYIAFQAIRDGHLSLDSVVTVSANAANQAPSRLGLKRGQKIQMRYLIRAAAIKSANDAATAIGEHISGSEPEFAALMTRTAKALGMTNTTFKNANGLTAAGHLSTARDMSILGRHLLYDFPEYYNLFSRRSADAGIATVRTTNSRFLDAYEGADGIKTGYTSAAGFNLTSSAKRGNKRIIATVFGGTSTAQRNAKIAELLDIGFRKANNNVKTRMPKAPAFAGGGRKATPAPAPEVDGALMAALVAEAVDPGKVGLPPALEAKRGSGAVDRSPRPQARPDRAVEVARAEPMAEPPMVVADDAVLAAIAEGVDDALSDLVPATPESASPLALAASMPPRPRPERAQDKSVLDEAIAVADAEVTPDEALPVDLAAETEATSPEADLTVAEASPVDAAPGAVVAASLRPMWRPARPGDVAPAEAVAAEAVAVAEAAPAVEAAPEAVAVAAVTPPRPQPRPADRFAPPAAEPVAEVAVAVVQADEPLPEIELASAAPRSEDPAPRGPVIEPEIFAEAPAEPQVVTRLSTSGGRNWGVNVGLYGSEYEAEKVLLTTALKESATLGKALRKVGRSPRGFQANFVGMTEDMAQLACSRLQARNIKCSTLSPG